MQTDAKLKQDFLVELFSNLYVRFRNYIKVRRSLQDELPCDLEVNKSSSISRHLHFFSSKGCLSPSLSSFKSITLVAVAVDYV